MTKERLEELIKQGETAYHIDGLEIKLLRNLVEVCGNTLYAPGMQWSIKNLYETKEQAEWALKTVAERTERFEPPMWEDIKDNYEFAFVNSEDNEFNLWKFNVFIGKEKDTGIITITDIKGSIFTEHATKENYEKACEIVRDLFKEGTRYNTYTLNPNSIAAQMLKKGGDKK